jgi:hypothetical protein
MEKGITKGLCEAHGEAINEKKMFFFYYNI